MRHSWILAAAPLFAQTVDFSSIHSILAARCVGCHSAASPQGGLELGTYLGVRRSIAPGVAAASKLIQRVTGEKGARMPLGGTALPDTEIALLRRWIDQGAPGPATPTDSGWKPSMALVAPTLPDSTEAHPIDKIVSAYMKERGVAIPAPAADAAFVRRAHLDLWGMTPPEGERADDVVERLLADRKRYASHWISFWNDLLRNDEGVVYHGDRKSITPWLRKALESNLPYDKFMDALLDPAPKDGPEGFLTGVNWRGDVSASQIPAMQAAQNSAQVFLGVNLKCNSCHDSFISRWKLKDAYGLAAFFADEPLKIHRCDIPTGEFAQVKFLYPELGSVDTNALLAAKRAAAARLFTMPANGRTPRTLVNRVWNQLFGRGLVEPPDDMDARPWSPELLDWLAADFVAHGYDMQHLLRRVMSSHTYRMASAKDEPAGAYVFRGPLPRRLSAEQFADSVSAITGEWRMLEPKTAGPASYARDWQLKSTALGRALGRPIRDQVFTDRQTNPTTLDALELVNGATLSTALARASRRLTGTLAEPPRPLFDSGVTGNQKVRIDIDVTGATKLWLLLENVDSYDPERVIAGWADARFSGPGGSATLAEVVRQTAQPLLFRGDKAPLDTVRVRTPSTLVAGISGRGFEKFQAFAGADEACLQSDINPRLRFFVFASEPDRRRLHPAAGDPPAPLPGAESNRKRLVRRLYVQAFSREPSGAEAKLAESMIKSADGLEDLLWAIFLSPEFQYIR